MTPVSAPTFDLNRRIEALLYSSNEAHARQGADLLLSMAGDSRVSDALYIAADLLTKTTVDELGGRCPIQGYGTTMGHPWYYRGRGSSRLSIAKPGRDPISDYSWVIDTSDRPELCEHEPEGYPGYWEPASVWPLIVRSLIVWRRLVDEERAMLILSRPIQDLPGQ